MAVTEEDVPPEPKVSPNIDAIIELLKPGGELANAAAKKQEGASAEGSVFQRIEKNLHGNRGAVSDIRKILKWSKDKQADYVRTLEPLLVHFGLTLEAIDPEDLIERNKAKAGEEGGGEPDGHNSKVTGLDAARERLAGGGGEEAQAAAAVKRGSTQLRKLIGALRAGMSVEDASAYSGIDGAEAADHIAAEKRGEYADLDVIGPSPKRAKPKLGIVSGGSGDETAQ